MDNLCWRCRKEIEGKPFVCMCGSELCQTCYVPHSRTHSMVKLLDSMLDDLDRFYAESDDDEADFCSGLED